MQTQDVQYSHNAEFVEDKGALGRAIGRARGRRYLNAAAAAVPGASEIDGDNDGMTGDGTPRERPARPKRMVQGPLSWMKELGALRKDKRRKRGVDEQGDLHELLGLLKDEDGGFSFHMADGHAKSGWAIARDGLGVAYPADRFFDKDGNETDEGIRIVQAFVYLHADKFFAPKEKGHTVVLGGWHNPKDGKVYLDVTDVFSKDSMSEEQAVARGVAEKQKSIANLDEIMAAIEDGDWENHQTGIDTNGEPTLLSDSVFNPVLDFVRRRLDEV